VNGSKSLCYQRSIVSTFSDVMMTGNKLLQTVCTLVCLHH